MGGHLKGSTVVDARNYILKNFGSEGIEKIKAALTKEDREIIYSPAMLPVTWVDMGAAVRHLMLFDQVLGKGDGKLALKMVQEIARAHFRGFYKVIFSLLSPEAILKMAPQLWKHFFDKGKESIEFPEPHLALSKLSDYRDIPLHHEYLNQPYIQTCLLMAGAKTCTVQHVKCMARGDEYCLSEYRWT
jgi:hypothetical protein